MAEATVSNSNSGACYVIGDRVSKGLLDVPLTPICFAFSTIHRTARTAVLRLPAVVVPAIVVTTTTISSIKIRSYNIGWAF